MLLLGVLNDMWADCPARLKKVSESDPLLAEEVEQRIDGDVPDTASEYSAVSTFSRASAASVRSGTSAVSILSSLVTESTISESSSATAFSIEGLDHALLSRGKGSYNELEGKKKTRKTTYDDKREKKQERKRGSRAGRDLLGLRLETDTCDELLAFARVDEIVRVIDRLSDALLLLGQASDRKAARDIQRAMDAYMDVISMNTPPCGPLYPRSWLEKRQMSSLVYFQDSNEVSASTWWKKVADGLVTWRATKKISFN
jgi:hypothetical protein